MKLSEDNIAIAIILIIGIYMAGMLILDVIIDGRSIREANCNKSGGSYVMGRCTMFR